MAKAYLSIGTPVTLVRGKRCVKGRGHGPEIETALLAAYALRSSR